jgi:hypothetical protein
VDVVERKRAASRSLDAGVKAEAIEFIRYQAASVQARTARGRVTAVFLDQHHKQSHPCRDRLSKTWSIRQYGVHTL